MLKLTLFKKERKKWKKQALQHVRFRIVFWAVFLHLSSVWINI